VKNSGASSVILGIDIGTTACKCVAFDSEFNVVAETQREYPLIHSNGKIEQDPEEWWKAVVETIREISTSLGRVKGIGISSQGITFVPVDKKGNPLMNALTWLDMRAADQCRKLESDFKPTEVFKKTGKRTSPAYTLPKLIWIKENRPDVYHDTHKFLLVHDYIINRLCGVFITEDSLAAGTMAYNINKKTWDKDILNSVGIVFEKLPKIVASGTIAGKLSEEAAGELGLTTDVKVSTGGQDQKCAAFGAGLSDNTATVSLGTSAAITTLYDKPVFTDDMSLPCFPFIDGKSWVVEGFASTAGASIKWYRDNLAAGRTYKEIDVSIENEYGNAVNNVMFFPYLGGTGSPEWYDADGGGFAGIGLDTTATHMAMAVLESVAFGIRANIDCMESCGREFSGLSIFGGGAYSDIWLRIIADVTGKVVRIPEIRQTACLGAAMKCASALGAKPIGEVVVEKTVIPDEDKHLEYIKKYRNYKRVEKNIYGG